MTTDLFTPVDLGPLALPNRVVMAPMTRTRAEPDGTPSGLMAEYFAQRASAGLIVTDCARVSPTGRGILGGPALHAPEHSAGWRAVTDAVHAEGGRVFAQIWHCGRVSHSVLLGGNVPVSASDRPAEGQIFTGLDYMPFEAPRPMTIAEIADTVADFARAARQAIDAGCDGVELHGAFGYLIDQFLQDGSNKRADGYGGSPSKRLRFLIEVSEAVVAEVGAERVGIKFSPSSLYYGMRDSDPYATFSAAIRAMSQRNLAYVHLMEPSPGDAAAPIREVARTFRPYVTGSTLLIANGGMDREKADRLIADRVADAISFGAPFIANPDLVERLRAGWPLATSDRNVWYGSGPAGYTDFPTYAPAQRVAV